MFGMTPSSRSRVVSILTRPEGRVQSGNRVTPTMIFQRFNPHPARRPGAILYEQRPSRSTAVSILTRPEGRVQYTGKREEEQPPEFQSSPGPKAGCNQSA